MPVRITQVDAPVSVTMPLIKVTAQKRLAAAGDYAAEDVMSETATAGAGTPFIFNTRTPQGTITKGIVLCSTTALTPRVTLYLYRKWPTCDLDDNDPNAGPNAADRVHYEGRIDFPAMEDLGGHSEAIATPSIDGNLPLEFVTEDGMLYGVAVTRDAITGEAAAMSLTFHLYVRAG